MTGSIVGPDPTHGPPAHARPPALERRGAARSNVEATALVSRHQAPAYGTARSVGVLDVSATGISLVLDGAALAPGEQFVVQVTGGGLPPFDSGGHPAPTGGRGRCDGPKFFCTVRSVRVRRDGRVRIGADFCDPDDAASADHVAAVRSTVGGSVRLGDASASPADRRPGRLSALAAPPPARARNAHRAERVALRELAPMYLCHADGGESPVEHIEVLDYSASGAALSRRAALATGDQLVLRVPREGEAPLTRLCAVTRVCRVDGRCVIGVRFIPFGRRRGRRLLARIVDWII
jgi:hypothetical protein